MPSPGRNVLLLGLASLLADVSSETLFAILPFFIVATGGAGLAVGVVGGLGDGVAEVVKLVGGTLADRFRRRKPLVAAGYGIAAVGKVGIALASAWPVVALMRALERTGKGVRTAPRDALLAESVPVGERGRAFGLHRAMDTAGAVLGVLLALALFVALGLSYATVIVASAVVGALAVLPVLAVREPPAAAHERKGLRVALAGLPPAFRRYLVVSALFGVANVSVLFFVLRGGLVADPARAAFAGILLYLAFNVVYAATSYPVGALSDRVGRPRVLAAGYAAYALAAASFAFARGPLGAACATVALALAYGIVQGPTRALAVDRAGEVGRGTALGTFAAVVGVASVVGSVVGGLLWDLVDPRATFVWAGGMAAVALLVGVANGSLPVRHGSEQSRT